MCHCAQIRRTACSETVQRMFECPTWDARGRQDKICADSCGTNVAPTRMSAITSARTGPFVGSLERWPRGSSDCSIAGDHCVLVAVRSSPLRHSAFWVNFCETERNVSFFNWIDASPQHHGEESLSTVMDVVVDVCRDSGDCPSFVLVLSLLHQGWSAMVSKRREGVRGSLAKNVRKKCCQVPSRLMGGGMDL